MQRSSKGGRRVRAGLIVAVAALSVMVFGASNARAAAFTTEIDDAALKIPGFAAFDILDPPAQATLAGDVTTATGAFNVPAAGFEFPLFSTGPPTFPIALTVDLNATEPIVGTIVPGTGVLTTVASDYEARVSLAAGPDCVFELKDSTGTPLAFSTEPDPNHPIAGDRFVFNSAPGDLLAGPPAVFANGVMSEGWASIPPAADPVLGGSNECAALNGLVAGPGGLAMGNGVDITVPAPATTPTPAPAPTTTKKKKCKKKKGKKGASAAKGCKKKKKK
jgi:hypothetical protein